jgi:hypothetical protein
MVLATGLAYIAFIMLGHIPSITSFFRAFIIKKMLSFVKDVFCIYWDDHVVFVLDSVYMLHCSYWFLYIEPSLHSWNETNLIVVYDLFEVLLNLDYWESLHLSPLKANLFSGLRCKSSQ